MKEQQQQQQQRQQQQRQQQRQQQQQQQQRKQRRIKPICQYSIGGARQDCVFTLADYDPGDYFHKKQPREEYARTVAEFIEETDLQKGCSLLAITAWGYADGLKYRGGLKWSAVPSNCRSTRRGLNLSEDDLAAVRECLMTHRISTYFGGNIGIQPMNWKKERTNYPDGAQTGSSYRKVEHIIERTGKCP
ncbi:MAG: hypothetical protein GY856_49025 [bacterium]|nr:hypothetical protein [bacterium]